MTLESRNALRKTFTRSQIVSVTAAATVLVMAVSTDSGVSRGGMKKNQRECLLKWKVGLFVLPEFLYIMFPEITKKSNSRKSKYIRLYE